MMIDAAAAEALFNKALTLHQQGDLVPAQEIYSQLLAQVPDHAGILFLSGIAALQMQNFAQAADLLGRAAAAHPANADAWFNHGIALLNLGQPAAALENFDKAIQLQPGHADAYNNRGIALRAMGRNDEALDSYDHALALQPQAPQTHNNRAVTLAELERHAEAAAACAQAIALKPDYAEAYNNQGMALRMLQRYDEALQSLTRAITLNPNDSEAHSNRGLVYTDLKQFEAALQDFDHAIKIHPGCFEAFNNRGVCLMAMGSRDAAVAAYQQAIAVKADYPDAHINLGHVLSDLNRFDEAASSYRTALQLKPQAPFVLGHLLHARMMNGDWEGIAPEIEDITQRISRGERTAPPFAALTFTGDPAVQRKAAEVWMHAKHAPRGETPAVNKTAGGKIRIGYFSMDFRQHAVAVLTAGLFEKHDRNQFEIYAFSYGSNDGDAMGQRLRRGFDKFIDIRDISDAGATALAREMQLDIAVDLAGYTKDGRTGIFARRAAPIQVAYLGYPGTMAAPYMDYIIADKTLIPSEARVHYAEKTVSLPVFQVNDDKRERPGALFSRAELGLPDKGFVFCCFNNSFKITPDVFAAWMRILKRVENSVLFLYSTSETFAVHLRREATAHGIAPERLIFGAQLSMTAYLARYAATDLFLDTVPFNAGATAADALWMDLPVLTCAGDAFASRMAASLLQALGAPELVTANLKDYEDRAVALATQSGELIAIKEKLARNRATSPLFNTTAFTRSIEKAYRQMYARARAGLPPDHITIG